MSKAPDPRVFGAPSPDAPPELAQFAFLVGRWDCTVRTHMPDGEVVESRGEWVGHYILDGHAIAEEYRQWNAAGELEQLGQNVRSYSVESGRWVLRWHDALAATWLELAPEDLGPIEVAPRRIRYLHHVPPGPAAKLFSSVTLFRVTYRDWSPAGFTWTAEVSRDAGASWEEVQRIEAARAR